MASFEDDLFDVFDENEPEDFNIEIPIKDKTEIDNKNDASSKTPVKRENGDADDSEMPEAKKKKDSLNLSEMQPRITVHTVETLEMCTHEVAMPPEMKYVPLVQSKGTPAKEYKFILDPFQKEAILCVENNQSVLVSAHTSAGKTVIAEYAIAKSLKNKQRVIYTTPIKALSNQKYREFQEEFKDVGLVTGDVTINMTASCLVMTTEILRNMLYRGSEIMREVGWVVFDEIHYMRDKIRGVVWEETLILLPDNVHYVFLSATIPNARQFAEWVTYLHNQPCHVVYTDYRPVPLQHYLFPAGGDGIHLVVDEKGVFKEDNFNSAMAVIQNSGDAGKGDQLGRRGGLKGAAGGESNIFKMVKMIMERQFAPVIIFSFSKKDCETYGMQLAKLDLTTTEEKRLVSEVFNNAMDVLSEEDRKLPQVENVLPLLKRGIGIHHGGLLPILKETIEILFAEGLIKALFATETFAMGLNMPARTVLFASPRKFDGKDFRWITSGEYIQMSGRAGRRGLDERGIVILMIDEKVSPAAGRDIIKGLPDPINSAFHLTYNMVLNLLRVEEINPEYMLERSFFQFQNQASIPALMDKMKSKKEKVDSFNIKQESKIASYYKLRQELDVLGKEFRQYITKPEYLAPFLQPGRLAKIKKGDDEYDWGVILNFKKHYDDTQRRNPRQRNAQPTTTYVIDMLLHLAGSSDNLENIKIEETMKPCPPGKAGYPEIVPVHHTLISSLSSLKIKYPKDLKSLDNRRHVLKRIKKVKEAFKEDQVPLLHPITDMNINLPEFAEIVKKIDNLESKIRQHPLHGDKELPNLYQKYSKKSEILQELKNAEEELQRAKSILQLKELKYRKRVLRRMTYCSSADVIELKGRVACELSSADELLLTEMIFNGTFNNLTVAQCLTLLSCFVCDEKSQEMPKISEDMNGPLLQMQDIARKIAKISLESHLEVEEDKYVEQFKPYLMDVVYAWANGASFLKICQMTDIFEGSIIRTLRRLEEVLRQMCQAAKSIGNTDLENKFSEGIKLIKRDIVFAASLYL